MLPEPEPMSVQEIRDALVIRERDLFLLTDVNGQVARGNRSGHGLYHADTRYLCSLELDFSTARPITLLSTAELGFSSEQVMTNPSMLDAEGQRLDRGTIHMRRTRVIANVLEETLAVRNHNIFAVSLELQYRLAADFADIFEIRGYEPRRRGSLDAPGFDNGALTMRYMGLDGRRRETLVRFDPEPTTLAGDADLAIATYRFRLEPQESFTLRLLVCIDGRLEAPHAEHRFAAVARSYSEWREGSTRVVTDNQFFNATLARSLDDIRMLWSTDPYGAQYPAAGTPWYDCLFGRDSCIVGMQTLAFRPEIAAQALSALARYQGTKHDDWRDEEPGKILHELRRGELTNINELPFSPYYGSIDSTPLFLLLAGEYLRWTGDEGLIAQLRPCLDSALAWLRASLRAGDGLLSYEKRSAKGLVNQGWKDSSDAIVHRDGSLVAPPIALAEVQAYACAALRRLAVLDGTFSEEAGRLAARFNRDFWMEADGCFALALDGEGRRAEAVASNAGHALWCGVADADKARRTAERLMAPDMFSGWGIRTLTAASPRYNPQGYHLGTIWPHDNSLIAMGFKRYGFEPELNVLFSALFEAAQMFPYHRLPELFGGSEQSGHLTPVPYPVACRPQSWAAGAIPLMTQAVLGLVPDAQRRTLYVVNPALPPFLQEVTVSGLRVGDGGADLSFIRRGPETVVEVLDVRGELSVCEVQRWPEHLL